MENVGAKIMIQLQKIKKAYDAYLTPLSLAKKMTKIQLLIIGFLANNPDYDKAKDIEEILDIKKSNISAAIDDLVNREYIIKSSDQNDRRIIHLAITNKSFEIVEIVRKAQEEFTKMIFKNISDREIEQYLLVVKMIINNINEVVE